MERPGGGQRFLRMLKNNLLTVLLVIGVVLGIVLGIVIRLTTEPMSERDSSYLGFPGDLLIRMLKCTAVPLILACVVVALGSMDLNVSKTLGWQLILYVFISKLVSSGIGIIVTVFAKPGKVHKYDESGNSGLSTSSTMGDIFLDMFRNIFPPNFIRMYIQQVQTNLIGNDTDVLLLKIDLRYTDNANLLGMIIVATVVGLTLTILREKGKGFLVFAKEVYHVSMKLAIWALWTAPVCLFFLILAQFLKIDDFAKFFTTWGIYILTINGVFLIVLVIVHPVTMIALGKINVLKLYRDIWPALLTAYVTASSMATLPLLIEKLIKNGVDERVVNFVVPIGVNINKDGAAVFMSSATVFVAQATDVDLSIGHYISIWILASFGSMAAAAVPFGAVIVLVMIINGVGLSQDMIAGILFVEWINDRGQTLTNVAGNAVATKLLAQWNKKLIDEMNKNEDEVEN